MLGRENGAKTCIRTTERAIADWLPFNSRRNHSYIANTILSDTARLEEHFYIGFDEYLMLGRENGTKTCLRTITTRMMNTVIALTFEEIIVI